MSATPGIIVSASNINVTTFFNTLLTSDQNVTNLTATSTSKSWTDPNGQHETLTGTNFTYASDGDFSGGTLTGYSVSDSTGNAQLTLNGLNVPIATPPSSPNGPLAAFTSGLTDVFYVTGTGDTVTTYGSANTVVLTKGGNTVIGGAGTTTVSFNDSFGDYMITPVTGGTESVAETSGAGTNGTNTVTDVTTLHFFDGNYTVGTGSFEVMALAATVSGNLAEYQTLAASGKLSGITLEDGGTPTLSISSTQLTADATALHDITGTFNLAVSGVTVANTATTLAEAHVVRVSVADSAANVSSALDSLQSLATSGKLTSISLTDSGTPTLTISATQLTNDLPVLNEVSGTFDINVTSPSTSATITGDTVGLGTTVIFSGASSNYSVSAIGNGHGLTVTEGSNSYALNNVNAIQFSDTTDIVASQTPPVAGAVSSAQVTELYGAVLGRTPDVGGLAFYQKFATANPSTPFLQFATWFLDSTEYTSNTEHNYAQTVAGDQQFITDSYSNLLHRTPSTSEVSFYENNVIAPMLNGLTPGTNAYTSADLQAHAQVLVYFSQSAEFISDVQVTAQNPSSTQHWLVLV